MNALDRAKKSLEEQFRRESNDMLKQISTANSNRAEVEAKMRLLDKQYDANLAESKRKAEEASKFRLSLASLWRRLKSKKHYESNLFLPSGIMKIYPHHLKGLVKTNLILYFFIYI